MARTSNSSRIFLATGLLAGGIIGAGVFALPFLIHQSGLVIGLSYLLLATLAYCLIHLMYAEVVLNTKGHHRFVGYVQQYLGSRYHFFAIWIAVIQTVFVLTIYLILSKSFMLLLFPNASELLLIFFFWILGSGAIFLNLKRIAASETLITLAMIAIIGVLFVLGMRTAETLSLTELFGQGYAWFLPLPAILFALSGRAGIPALVESLSGISTGQRNRAVKKSVLLGTVIPAIVYLTFILGVLALTPLPSEDAVSSLLSVVPTGTSLLIGLLGIFSLWSSYLLIGFEVDATLKQDLRFSLASRLLIVILAPLLLYYSGFTSFILLIGFVGGIFLVLEALFIVKMWNALWKKKPEHPLFRSYSRHISTFVVLLFLLALVGLVFQLWG